ncbi:MAG: hypothetical protein OEW31_06800 [Thermoleophilia bacterium]|nr:hypothetical protein [Thermoleophilia bacterium]
MRAAWSTALLAVVVVLAPGGSAGAQGSGTLYLVRPDPRLCPSPLCGGAWVRRVNHAVTRCADGSVQRECYVARVSGVPEKLTSARAGSTLVRGRLVPAGLDGFPGLGALAATAAWRPAGPRPPTGTTFRVRDNGVRCVTTPCFSLTAQAVEGGGRATLSGLDLTRAGVTRRDEAQAWRVVTRGGLLVTGTVRRVPRAGPAGTGRALRATQVWLRP